MKPCRSPYCECTPHCCSHPHFYDARHLPFYQHTMPINPRHQAAYEYAQAIIQQQAAEDALSKALRTLGSDNQIIDLCSPLRHGYRNLLSRTVGENIYDWLEWWMYETDHGTKKMEFQIGDTWYNPQEMTLYRFLEIVDVQ